MKKRPSIGVALGSGATRGFAHIGVLKVLDKYNIPIDYIAGSSIGALIGAFYSLGMDLDILVKVASELERKRFLDFSFCKDGIIQGNRIEGLIKAFVNHRGFKDMKIPTAVVATDLVSCRRIIFNDGNLVRALRASISIPGIFTPVKMDDMILVDGGVIDRVPVSVVRDMGAEIVISVDIGWKKPSFKSRNIVEILMQVWGIMEQEIVKKRFDDTDILIQPDVEEIDPLTFDKAEECVETGIIAAEKMIPVIKEMLSNQVIA